jgi:hypothetical protein
MSRADNLGDIKIEDITPLLLYDELNKKTVQDIFDKLPTSVDLLDNKGNI